MSDLNHQMLLLILTSHLHSQGEPCRMDSVLRRTHDRVLDEPNISNHDNDDEITFWTCTLKEKIGKRQQMQEISEREGKEVKAL